MTYVYMVEIKESPTYTRYDFIKASSREEAYEISKRDNPHALEIFVFYR